MIKIIVHQMFKFDSYEWGVVFELLQVYTIKFCHRWLTANQYVHSPSENPVLLYLYIWHRPLMLTAGYPKALIPFHVPNNIPSTSTWPIARNDR